MSKQHVAAFRRGIEAANRRDIDALLAVTDPQVELYGAMAVYLGGEATVYRGHSGARDWLRDLEEAFAEIRFDYPEIHELGERIVAIGSVHARGKTSGTPVDSRVGCVVEFRSGRLKYVRAYLDPAEAIEAARERS